MKKLIVLMSIVLFALTITRDFGGVVAKDSDGQSVRCQKTFSGYVCS